MDMCRRREILAARHQGYALDRIVDRDREVITCRELLAGEHYIAVHFWLRLSPAFTLDPVERASQCNRARQVEPPGVINSRTHSRSGLSGSEPAAGAGINRLRVAMRRSAGACNFGLDLAPCAKAGVEHTQRIE